MSDEPKDEKKGQGEVDDLVMVVPFNSTSDLLIMSLKEYKKMKRRGDITREMRKNKAKEDV